MHYKAISFDYGGVIAGPTGTEFNRQVCAFLGVSLNRYHEVYFQFNSLMNSGQITRPELWRMVLDTLGKSERYDEFIKLQNRLNNNEVHSNMLQLVDTLRKNGYKVGLLTNNTIQTANYIRSTDLVNHFDVCVMSSEIGISKPDPKIFEYFFSKLGTPSQEAIFIDDAEKSLSTAAEVGYHPIFFNDHSDLVRQLRTLDVKVD